MPSAWLTNFIASLEASPTERQPTTQELAADIIRRSNRYRYNLPTVGSGLGSGGLVSKPSPVQKGPSTIQRVLDIVSRPLYGTMEAFKQDIKHGGLIDNPFTKDRPEELKAILGGAALGWAGKRKTTAADVYEEAGFSNEGKGAFVRNLATDAVLDPLNAVPFGWLLRAGRSASKTTTAAERVERALGSPVVPSGRTSYGRATRMPGREAEMAPEGTIFTPESPRRPLELTTGAERYGGGAVGNALLRTARFNRRTDLPNRRSIDLGGGTTRPPVEIAPPVDPIPAALERTRNLPRGLPNKRAIDLGGGQVREPIVPKSVQEVLADVIPKPTRQIDVEKLGVPPRAIEEPRKFRLDVDKISKIEIARALGPKGARTSEEYTAGKAAVDADAKVPVYGLNGQPTGTVNAKQLEEYIRTGKAPIPKESEIPDMTGWSEARSNRFWSKYLVPDKRSLDELHVLNDGVPVSIKAIRQRVLATKKAKKLKDVLPEEVAVTKPANTTAWRKAAKEAGLTRGEIDKVLKAGNDDEALALLREFADKPLDIPAAPAAVASATNDVFDTASLPTFEIADAEDIVEAVAEGSQTATKAMAEAVEANRPRQIPGIIDERGGRAIAKVAEQTVKNIKQGKTYGYPRANPFFNPAKQVNAIKRLEAALVDEGFLDGFTKISKTGKYNASTGKVADARRSALMKHLESFEDAMIAAGYPPTNYAGVPIRLSDLIQAAGGIHVVMAPKGLHLTDLFGDPKKFEAFLSANPEAAQLVEKAKAAHAAYTADLVNKGKEAALSAAQKAEIDPTRTATEVATALHEAPSVAKEVVKAVSDDLPAPDAVRIAAEHVKALIDGAKPSVTKIAEKDAPVLTDVVSSGRTTVASTKTAVAMHRAALKTAGVEPTDIAREVSKAADSSAARGLLAGLMKAFNPAFENADLHPYLIENKSLFQTRTAEWSKALGATFRKYNAAQRTEAFSALQKGLPVGDDTTRAAAIEFEKAIDSMLGTTGFREAATSDVVREAITMGEINHILKLHKAKFRFVDEIVDDLGRPVKLERWTDSWKYHNLDGEDPVQFLKQMRDAVDQIMMEKTIFDNMTTVFGKVTGKTQFQHPRLKGVEFDPEIRPQVARFMEIWDELHKPNSKLAQQYDQILRLWKSGVTIYSPSHHVRNLVGDVSLAWLAGVNNPRVYQKAAKVLKAKRGMYEDMEQIDELVAPGGQKRALSRSAKQKIVRVAGRDLDAEQIWQIAFDRGLLPHSKVVEDIPTGVREAKIPQPLGGKGRKIARQTSETREHYVRLAHFIDSLSKYKGKNIEEAIDQATRVTRKWHPDGLDLTEFEHRVMRRAFPFYSWTRKAIPLILEGAVKKPAKIIAPNKAIYNLQVSMGLDPESLSEPFPEGMQFPDWIRDMSFGPVTGSGKIVGQNLLPFLDLPEDLANDPQRGIAGMLTPAVRLPGELLSQNVWQTGQPFESMDKSEYIDKQVPLLSVANRLAGTNLGAGSVEAAITGDASAMIDHKKLEGTESPSARRDSFLNYLFAAGIIDTQSPANIKSAEFDQRDRVAEFRRKLREKAGG